MSGVAAMAEAPTFGWTRQPFESSHLGVACARIIDYSGTDARARLERTLAGLQQEKIALVTVRVAAGEAVAPLREAGAVEMERLVTLERRLPDCREHLPKGVRPAARHEAERCAEIGRRSFVFDRFHRDPRIASNRANALKGDWMRNACLGRADVVLVAEEEGHLVGANACLFKGDQAVIDLIGVVPEARGRGLGRRLVDGSIAHYSGRAARLRVGTQADNTASIALYRSAGFDAVDEQITFHLHLGQQP